METCLDRNIRSLGARLESAFPVAARCESTSRDRKGVPMGLWPTKADGNPLANARGSAWDAHCKQSRDRKGADGRSEKVRR